MILLAPCGSWPRILLICAPEVVSHVPEAVGKEGGCDRSIGRGWRTTHGRVMLQKRMRIRCSAGQALEDYWITIDVISAAPYAFAWAIFISWRSVIGTLLVLAPGLAAAANPPRATMDRARIRSGWGLIVRAVKATTLVPKSSVVDFG